MLRKVYSIFNLFILKTIQRQLLTYFKFKQLVYDLLNVHYVDRFITNVKQIH